jgi:hypothetical protein
MNIKCRRQKYHDMTIRERNCASPSFLVQHNVMLMIVVLMKAVVEAVWRCRLALCLALCMCKHISRTHPAACVLSRQCAFGTSERGRL